MTCPKDPNLDWLATPLPDFAEALARPLPSREDDLRLATPDPPRKGAPRGARLRRPDAEITRGEREQLVRDVARLVSLEVAATAMGIGEAALQRALERHPAFVVALQAAVDGACERLEALAAHRDTKPANDSAGAPDDARVSRASGVSRASSARAHGKRGIARATSPLCTVPVCVWLACTARALTTCWQHRDAAERLEGEPTESEELQGNSACAHGKRERRGRP